VNDTDSLDPWRPVPRDAADPLELTGGLPPPEGRARPAPPAPPAPPQYPGHAEALEPGGPLPALPIKRRRSRWRWVVRGIAALIILFVIAVAWLAFTAPLSKSLQPPVPPSITLLSAEGTPIAKRGAIIGDPVNAAKLPAHVRNAFIAIEDRRFYKHWGVDPRGILRAAFHNLTSRSGKQGGSTITQQLAKNAFLDSDRTATRKFQEVLIAFWLEAWLNKDEILSRYLSNVYFGDNVYGLRAAAKHYFSTTPERLSVSQAAMLAGLVQAPSRLAPTGNLSGARARQKLVVAAMAETGFITKAEAADAGPARLRVEKVRDVPSGTYFADWVLPQARDRAGEISDETTVKTTLEVRLQKAAERAVRNAGLKKAQVALVAMHPDGRIAAMVGGKNYATSPFNRATQARRQPGSTFKLFVYLAALRSGMTPDSIVEDSPVKIGDWSPSNSDGRYEGEIPLRRAFAKSSNVAAARLIQKVGTGRVIQAARDLGISTPIADESSIALGTSTVSLLELTSAYAAIAAGEAPVRPRGLEAAEEQHDSWLRSSGPRKLSDSEVGGMRDLLATAVRSGTGRAAGLSIDSFGKTGTTQDARDVLFVGFAGDLVVGVWVGNDDNSPNAGLTSGLPARIWRDFMQQALGVGPAVPPQPVQAPDEIDNETDGLDLGNLGVEVPPMEFHGQIGGQGLNLRFGPDGQIDVRTDQRGDDRRRRPPRDDRYGPPEDYPLQPDEEQ